MKRWLIIAALVPTSLLWAPPLFIYTAVRHGRHSALALAFPWEVVSAFAVPHELWHFHGKD